MTTANNAGDAGRLIGRLPADRRLVILDAIAHAAAGEGKLVRVEHAYNRKLDENNTTTLGRVIGIAYNAGAGDVTLVVDPVAADRRMVAIPAAHVLRVRWAYPYGALKPGAYRIGEVLAGPPVRRSTEES